MSWPSAFCLARVFGAAIAWIFFGHMLDLVQIAGILVTSWGISWELLTLPQAGNENIRMVIGRWVLFEPLSAIGGGAYGALFGPVIGVSSSFLAFQFTGIGVASTLMDLPPVFMMAISYFVFKDRFNWQAASEKFIAMSGVALFL